MADEKKPDTITVPAWVRTIVIALFIASVPSLTLWQVNLEYRMRLSEEKDDQAERDSETLRRIENDVAVVKTQMKYVHATLLRLEGRVETSASP